MHRNEGAAIDGCSLVFCPPPAMAANRRSDPTPPLFARTRLCSPICGGSCGWRALRCRRWPASKEVVYSLYRPRAVGNGTEVIIPVSYTASALAAGGVSVRNSIQVFVGDGLVAILDNDRELLSFRTGFLSTAGVSDLSLAVALIGD